MTSYVMDSRPGGIPARGFSGNWDSRFSVLNWWNIDPLVRIAEVIQIIV